jgi:hypothetical protein
MAGKIQIRRDTATNWTSVNPILASGEIGLETDTDLFKIGDGVTVWSSRAYGGIQGATGATGVNTIPSSGADKTTTYTLTTDDVGGFVSVGSGGSVTIPASVFSAGDVITLYNDTNGDITITCSAVTSYVVGIDTNISSALLSTRGLCTVMFVDPNKCILGGTIT